MATLIFSAIGTLIGGPLGGIIGALAGRQVDGLIFRPGSREGPRLADLKASTSSYGLAIPRHFGRMRVAGAIIWATDLVEHRDKQGGGKGRPSVTGFSYSASFAVALASRPLQSVGRVWADGKLLRGTAGDLKVGGQFRLHSGHGNQDPDPLIAAAEAAGQCPAFRGIAYAVFEDLDLSEYGNRIPALTFEVIADSGTLTTSSLFDGVMRDIEGAVPLDGIAGLSCEGPLAETLAMLDPVFPMDCDASGDVLTLAPSRLQASAIVLPDAATSVADGDFGGNEGFQRKRGPEPERPLSVLRYYDLDRDFQPGAQRAPGRPSPGEPQTIELPAAIDAANARLLVDRAARRVQWSRQTLSWRVSQLDPAVTPGKVVSVPGHPGQWRVREWEWRDTGIELTLVRLAPGTGPASIAADAGRANTTPDVTAVPSALVAYELPWDGNGSGATPAVFAAVSSASPTWQGAALFVDQGDGTLQSLAPSGRGRAVLGSSIDALPQGQPFLFDRGAQVTIELIADDMSLAPATPFQMAMGANRALLGDEIIQFAAAVPLGNRRWRLEGLLRGRGGTEYAVSGHGAGERFVLLDATPVALDPAAVGSLAGASIAAIGLGDPAPVRSPIALRGTTLRPLAPVRGALTFAADGNAALTWIRRARGAWLWADGVDTPLNEQVEAYDITYGALQTPLFRWETSQPGLTITAANYAALQTAFAHGSFFIRQRGDFALSDALAIATP